MSDDFSDLGFKEHAAAPAPGHDDFSDLGFKEAVAPPTAMEAMGAAMEAMGRGALQGGTLGFADEIAGAGNAAEQAVRKMSVSDLVKDYVSKRDAYREADAKVRSAHPIAFGAGEVGTGLATAFNPALNIAKGATLGARALTAAKLGGIVGLGSSNADLTQGQVGQAAVDTAKGAALGGVLQPFGEKILSPVAGYIAKKAGQGAGFLGKKALNFGLDVPDHVTERYMANPQGVNNAMSRQDLGQKLADTLGEVRGDTGKINSEAMATLGGERLPHEGFELNRALHHLGSVNDEGTKALKAKLEKEYLERVGGITRDANPEYLSERELHEVKKTLQQATDWKKPLPTYEQATARQASADLNQTLKSGNTDYASGMDELSKNINAKGQLAQKFGLKPDFTSESGYKPSDSTMGAIADVARAKKIDRRAVLASLKEQGYGDLGEDVQNTIAKETLSGGLTNGSRKVHLFGGLGAAAGAKLGMGGAGAGYAIGATAGAAADKYGRAAGKKLMDGALLVQKLQSTPQAQRFSGLIKSAAARGNTSLAATHFLLQQTEPDYNKAVNGE